MSFNGSLALWLQKRTALPSLQEVISIVQKVADALQQLHNQQKIYQDINPYNVLISISGENAERIDLRLSTGSDKNIEVNSQLMYTAPEQWNGEAVPATDQYALAVMTYQLLTGRPPFRGTPKQLVDLQINVQPAAPSTLNQHVPPAIDSVVLSALAKRPEDRFPSVSAFAHALEQAIQRPASQFVSVAEKLPDNILRVSLLISKTEAEKGTVRMILLPSGRLITVSVPEDAKDGQIIRLEGFNDLSPMGPAGVLLITLTVSQTQASTSAGGLTKQKKKNFKVFIGRKHTTLANRPREQKAVAAFLVLLALIIILVSGGIGLRLWTSNVRIPYPPLTGSLAIDDPLRNNTGSYNWPEDGMSSGGGTCQFNQGAYHVVMTRAESFHYCIAGNTGYSDFAYEVRMTIIKGDAGGIIFRSDGLNSKFYYFRIGRDGSYSLYLYVDTVGTHARRLASGITPAIHTDLNHPNLLAVVARSDTLDLYVNNQKITRVSNNTYSSGQIGVAAAVDTDPTEVVFSNTRVWVL
jgi:hypothetical protein